MRPTFTSLLCKKITSSSTVKHNVVLLVLTTSVACIQHIHANRIKYYVVPCIDVNIYTFKINAVVSKFLFVISTFFSWFFLLKKFRQTTNAWFVYWFSNTNRAVRGKSEDSKKYIRDELTPPLQMFQLAPERVETIVFFNIIVWISSNGITAHYPFLTQAKAKTTQMISFSNSKQHSNNKTLELY